STKWVALFKKLDEKIEKDSECAKLLANQSSQLQQKLGNIIFQKIENNIITLEVMEDPIFLNFLKESSSFRNNINKKIVASIRDKSLPISMVKKIIHQQVLIQESDWHFPDAYNFFYEDMWTD